MTIDRLDASSLPCPGPVIELRTLLEAGAEAIDILVADEAARSNVTRFAISRGAQATSAPVKSGFMVSVRVPESTLRGAVEPDAERSCRCPEPDGARVLQLSGDTMGSGDRELGALLLRGFLKTSATAQPRPGAVVCYNSAVKLCCAGSPVLDELRALEAEGAAILSCGTCLNYYGLSEQLAVGRITDMLEIVSVLGAAKWTTRP
jgi:selenium metabolism protein YedF